MKTLLTSLVSTSGNCVNLGRVITTQYQDLHNFIISSTEFLPAGAKYTERIYCVLHSIPQLVVNSDSSPSRFINLFKGYCVKLEKIPKLIKVPRVKATKKTYIEEHISRTRRRDAALYEADKVLGIDYVICPEINTRKQSIDSKYIVGVLNMTVAEYDAKYPNIQKSCANRSANIKAGLQAIDLSTGLTKYELSQIKARATLATVDENGMSGYDRKGVATRATHMANIDDCGRNGYSQLASKAIVKGNTTKVANGLILDPSLRTEFYRYKAVVAHLTDKFRGIIDVGYITGLAGTPGAYHIDHNYSIMQGYQNRVSPVIIGHRNNLSMITWEENLKKHASSSITFDQLIMLTNYTKDQSESEFETVIALIREDSLNNVTVSGARILERLYDPTLYKK